MFFGLNSSINKGQKTNVKEVLWSIFQETRCLPPPLSFFEKSRLSSKRSDFTWCVKPTWTKTGTQRLITYGEFKHESVEILLLWNLPFLLEHSGNKLLWVFAISYVFTHWNNWCLASIQRWLHKLVKIGASSVSL